MTVISPEEISPIPLSLGVFGLIDKQQPVLSVDGKTKNPNELALP
ncbi:hypothetical protein RKD55_001076 [Rossellomorea marisflavi]